MTSHTSTARPPSGLFALSMGAVGVVYGDIGTSPLYAFRESLAAVARESGAMQPAAVLGVLSLILWTLIIIVTLKYVMLLLRADNHGEGGILSLMALAQGTGRRSALIATLGIAGAALFYGDAVITPAISVLSAVEGLTLVTHSFEPYVIPIALGVIVMLFAVQRRGTEKVAWVFGPVMVLWFIAMTAGGLLHIRDAPEVWQAFNPTYGLHFLMHHGLAAFMALGAVFLAVTGAEALYADLGHFGKRPVRITWLWFVMPALMINYIGQAALVLAHPEAAENAFFLLYPDWALLPMVILATLATVIASQAVITGAFSLTHQAIQLGLLPRLHVQYTSPERAGQIYLPQVNWALLAGVVLLIAVLRTSSDLAAAYGIAVTATMAIDALLIGIVMRHVWHWPLPLALMAAAPLLLIDLTFLSANLLKLPDGGYLPVLLSGVLIVMMRTWVRGSRCLHEQTRDPSRTMESVTGMLQRYPPQRVGGTAIYLTSNTDYAPSALLQNLQHNKVLHERNFTLTLRIATTPHVPDSERIAIERLCDDFTRIFMTFGYMETPNVTKGLLLLRDRGIPLDMMSTSFFISRRNILPSRSFGMPLWRDRIFIAMSNNATDAADYFHIPLSRVVELGVQMTV